MRLESPDEATAQPLKWHTANEKRTISFGCSCRYPFATKVVHTTLCYSFMKPSTTDALNCPYLSECSMIIYSRWEAHGKRQTHELSSTNLYNVRQKKRAWSISCNVWVVKYFRGGSTIKLILTLIHRRKRIKHTASQHPRQRKLYISNVGASRMVQSAPSLTMLVELLIPLIRKAGWYQSQYGSISHLLSIGVLRCVISLLWCYKSAYNCLDVFSKSSLRIINEGKDQRWLTWVDVLPFWSRIGATIAINRATEISETLCRWSGIFEIRPPEFLAFCYLSVLTKIENRKNLKRQARRKI